MEKKLPKSCKSDLETKAQKNRRLMPHTAATIDWLRSELGNIKVLYAEEGNYRMGTPIDRSKLAKPAIQEGIPHKEKRKKK